MGNLDLLILSEKIREAKRQAWMRRDAARKAKAEYATLRNELQPRIEEVSELADQFAQEFRRLYRAAPEAYEARNGALAKELSARGRRMESECKNLNKEKGELIEQLKEAYQKYKDLYDEAEEYDWKVKEYESKARALRDTPVEGFTGSSFMSDREVENFLNEFPRVVFGKIAEINYFDELRVEGGVRCLGETTGIPDANMGIMPALEEAQIAIYRNDSKAATKQTIAHEIGHVIFNGFMDGVQRRRWRELYEERRKMGRRGLVTDYAGTNADEGFCEWFAYFKMRPEHLEKFDEKGYTFIKNMHRQVQDL